jgi:hypothetical protein
LIDEKDFDAIDAILLQDAIERALRALALIADEKDH